MDSSMLTFYKSNKKMMETFESIINRTCKANDIVNPLDSFSLSDLFCLLQLLSENIRNKNGKHLDGDQKSGFNGRLAILSLIKFWMKYGQEYHFRPQIAAAIADTEINEIPVDVIRNPPYPTIFIKNPFPEYDCEGYLIQGVTIDDINRVDGNTIFVIKIKNKNQSVDPLKENTFNRNPVFFIDISQHKTFEDMLLNNGISDFAGINEVKSVISMYAYLCCQNKEVIVKEKAVKRLLSGEKVPVTHNEVGVKYEKNTRVIYSVISRPDAESPKRTVAGHYRKAHYHTYLCGTGRSERIVKWIAPTIVNGGMAHKAMVTISA